MGADGGRGKAWGGDREEPGRSARSHLHVQDAKWNYQEVCTRDFVAKKIRHLKQGDMENTVKVVADWGCVVEE